MHDQVGYDALECSGGQEIETINDPVSVGVGFSRRGRTKFGFLDKPPEAARAG
jgi:hypothetical protein